MRIYFYAKTLEFTAELVCGALSTILSNYNAADEEAALFEYINQAKYV